MKTTISRQTEESNIHLSRRPSSARRKLLIVSIGVVLLIGIAGGYLLFQQRVQPLTLPHLPAHLSIDDLGLTNWQDYQHPLPTDPLSNTQLPTSPVIDPALAELEDAAGQSLIHQGILDRGLSYLRAAAQSIPDNLRYSNDYRLALRDHKLYTDEITFFSLQAQKVVTANTAISLALTYVDEMRSCPPPPDGLVCQAQNSSRSISELDKVLEQHPYNIIAHFARGLNHLYWPSLMGHLPRAETDLEYAVALTQVQGVIGNAFSIQAYVALGDVFAKGGQISQARNIWLNGKLANANATNLDQRLSIPNDQLVNAENNTLRGLGVYVDTNIAIFWQPGR